MEEERIFVAYCSALCLGEPILTFSHLSKEIASDGIRPEREPFGFGSALGTTLKYLYSAICVLDVRIVYMYGSHDGELIFAEIFFANEGLFTKFVKYTAREI